MRTDTTYTWKFYTAGVDGKCKCSKCGKTIKKRFTIQYREDSSPDLEWCKKQRDKWEKEEHICLVCMKKSLGHPYSAVLNK